MRKSVEAKASHFLERGQHETLVPGELVHHPHGERLVILHQGRADSRTEDLVQHELLVVAGDFHELRDGEVEDIGVLDATGEDEDADAIVLFHILDQEIQLLAHVNRDEVDRGVVNLHPKGVVHLTCLEIFVFIHGFSPVCLLFNSFMHAPSFNSTCKAPLPNP